MAKGSTLIGLGEGMQNVAQIIMGMYQQKRENEDRKLRAQQVQSAMETDALQRALATKELGRFDQDAAIKDAQRTQELVGLEEMISNPAYAGAAKTLGIDLGQRVLPSQSLGGVAPAGQLAATQSLKPSGDYLNGVKLPPALARQRELEQLRIDTARTSAANATTEGQLNQFNLSEAQRKAAALQRVLGSGAPANTPQGRLGLAEAGLQPGAILGEAPEDLNYLANKYRTLYGAQYGAMKDAGAWPTREDPQEGRKFRGLTEIVDNITMELNRLSTARPDFTRGGNDARMARIQALRAAQTKLYKSLAEGEIDPDALQEAITVLTTEQQPAAGPLQGGGLLDR